MEDLVVGTISRPRFEARLLTIFALLSLLLAAVGTYGVLAHDVMSRTREIGLRMALGAKRAAVIRMMVGRVMRVSVPGIALGILGALALARVLTYSLFEMSASDPATLATTLARRDGGASTRVHRCSYVPGVEGASDPDAHARWSRVRCARSHEGPEVVPAPRTRIFSFVEPSTLPGMPTARLAGWQTQEHTHPHR